MKNDLATLIHCVLEASLKTKQGISVKHLDNNPYNDENEEKAEDKGVVFNDTLYVYPAVIEKKSKSLRGEITTKYTGFKIDIQKIIPGCHTMPNGDPGYPDDVDYDALAECITVYDAASKILTFFAEQEINNILEAMSQAHEYEDSKKQMEETF